MRRCAQCQVDYPDVLEFCPTDGIKLPPLAGETRALYDPLIGSTIDGRYVVEAILGEGGMGVVYAGRHAIIDKRVAVKVLRKEAAADESAAQRFLAEAKAASKIGQQNIVDITDFGVLPDGHAYFVMEFLDGPTLGKIMTKRGPIEPARAAVIAQQVCRGLHAAHAKNIVHRDLKPENIFVLERDGVADFVKIVDFGIARDIASKKRLTVAGMVMGTPEYMAPEQASGQEIDHRADQYALGCILYESLTCQVPFRGENAMQTLTKHVFEALCPPSRARPDLLIPPALEAIVVRALEKKRDARYADMEAMYSALEGALPSLRGIQVPEHARLVETIANEAISDSAMLASMTGRRRKGLFTAGAAGLASLALIAFLLFRGTLSAKGAAAPELPVQPATVPRPATAPVTPEQSPTPTQATAGAKVQLQLASVPAGSEVFLGDELLGTTPFSMTRSRDIAAPLTLVFRKAGYKEVSRLVSVAANAYVEVELHGQPSSRRAPTHPSGSTTPAPARSTERTPAQAPASTPERPPARAPDHTADHPPAHHNSELRDPFSG